jgi:hypothetical protein
MQLTSRSLLRNTYQLRLFVGEDVFESKLSEIRHNGAGNRSYEAL